jgi:CrcB protein
MVQKIIFLALAGATGTLARYSIAGFVHRISGASFPFGTLAVNAFGCFLAGFLWTLFENRWPIPGETRAILLVGFLGAFTTFSAYILETGELLRSAQFVYAALNVLVQTSLGFAALFTGIILGRMT